MYGLRVREGVETEEGGCPPELRHLKVLIKELGDGQDGLVVRLS